MATRLLDIARSRGSVLLPLVAGALIGGCGGAAHKPPPSQSAATLIPAPRPPDYRVTYPAHWAPQRRIPRSAYLGFVAMGRPSSSACPDPLILVRRQGAPGGTLDQAVSAYNQVEQLRRPARRVLAQRAVTVTGASQAVLIEAQYPTPDTSAVVHSYDLLVLSTRGVAFHVFASGCATDLPARFVERYILSFDAATGRPGATAAHS